MLLTKSKNSRKGNRLLPGLTEAAPLMTDKEFREYAASLA